MRKIQFLLKIKVKLNHLFLLFNQLENKHHNLIYNYNQFHNNNNNNKIWIHLTHKHKTITKLRTPNNNNNNKMYWRNLILMVTRNWVDWKEWKMPFLLNINKVIHILEKKNKNQELDFSQNSINIWMKERNCFNNLLMEINKPFSSLVIKSIRNTSPLLKNN